MDCTVYLIPAVLEEEAIHTIPTYIKDAVAECQVFFVENERTARRFLKKIWPQMIIDNYEWHTIHKKEDEISGVFSQKIKEGKTIGIISEAGCPGVADPGQKLIHIAQEQNASVKPLVGPSSVLLALMASGMNGQQFRFIGYLPVNEPQRSKAIKDLEADSQKTNCTQIFIETPYRNNQLIDAVLKNCNPNTQLCIAADITGKAEWIKTKTISAWKKEKPDMHKRPVIFCIYCIS